MWTAKNLAAQLPNGISSTPRLLRVAGLTLAMLLTWTVTSSAQAVKASAPGGKVCAAQWLATTDHGALKRGQRYSIRCASPDRKGRAKCDVLDRSGRVVATAGSRLIAAKGTGGQKGGSRPTETITMNYTKIEWVYSEICADSSARWATKRRAGENLQVEGRSAQHAEWINLLSVSQSITRPMATGQSVARPGGLTTQGRDPQHVNPRDYEPSGLAVVGDPQPKPFLQQLGGTAANVPMKHGSCGLDCGTHVLVSQSGNLDVPIKLGLTCPAGLKVTYLGFQPQGKPLSPVKVGSAPSVVSNLSIQPFSASDLESACQAAMGGSWAQPNRHNNRRRTVKTSIRKSVRAWGECTGWSRKTFKDTVMTLTLTCIDQNWN